MKNNEFPEIADIILIPEVLYFVMRRSWECGKRGASWESMQNEVADVCKFAGAKKGQLDPHATPEKNLEDFKKLPPVQQSEVASWFMLADLLREFRLEEQGNKK